MIIVRPVDITDAVFTSSSIAENDYAAWSSGSTYADGDRVIVAASHEVYESLQGSNTNHTPSTSPDWWVLVGATNRWRMFDENIGQQSQASDSIAVTLSMGANRADSLVLLNVDASDFTVTMTDPLEGVIYDEDINLVSDSGVQDWHAYFFEPIDRLREYAITDMPINSGTTIALTINNPGGTVSVGEAVLGLARNIGGTEHGASIGIRDYSKKDTDAFGNVTVVERAFSKRGTFTVLIDAGLTEYLQYLLSDYRATPIVYIGATERLATMIYGFYRDFSIVIAYPEHSVVNIEIEGLT